MSTFDLDDLEFTLTLRALQQIKAEVWNEASLAHERYLGAHLAGFKDAPPYPVNPYVKEV